MSVFSRRSIRRKLILLFTSTAALTVFIACSFLWAYQLVSYRASLYSQESATAQLLADSSGPALLFDDVSAARETLSTLRTDKRIRVACLYDKRGRLVADFAPLQLKVSCPEANSARSRFTSRQLLIARPIEVKGEVVGLLYLEVALSEMYKILRHLAEIGLCVLLITTVFALGLSSFLERLISGPILHLTTIATQVSRDGNYLLRAQRISDDETGVLIDQFNLMMDHIQERDVDLKNARSGLEDKIEKRTTDLRNEIAERKTIERDLGVAKLLAEQSNKAKSMFLANMSHELRTPLNAIIGYSEMLHEDAMMAGVSESSADLEKILNSARHLLSLISDILDFSKIEAGEMKLYPELVLSSEILDDVISTARVLAKPNRNILVLSEPFWRGSMFVDALRFRQSMLNLIGNACKFTKDGTISISIEHRMVDDKPWIHWSVRDTGVGIALSEQSRLFQTFSQVDSSATRVHGGSGLGLAISQQLCKAMGGHITVDSLVDVGSTFTICLPDESASL